VIDTTALKALESEVHVWNAYPGNVPAQHLVEQFLPLLNQEENHRYRRLHFDQDRHTYLAAHALVRIALSRYASYAPTQWEFTRGPHGRPEIKLVTGLPALRFNLSHTQGMVACVITLDRDCGIDVERIRPMKDMAGIADTVFSSAEIAYLHSQNKENWPHHFFKFWTLKEAYIKAIGQGFSAPLKNITFDISMPKIQATFDNQKLTDAGWYFHHGKPTSTHHLAVTAKSATPLNTIFYELNLTKTVENCVHKCDPWLLAPD
jgi:4'-phosphopantetheinyl transferase